MSDIPNEELPKRGPGRPPNALRETPRQEEVRTRRRRRSGNEEDRNLKLFIPESMKDPTFSYRWVNDRPGRVRQMTVEDDWDVVDTAKLGGDPDPDRNTAEGTVMARVGDKQTGERMTLIRKPKDLFEADRKEKHRALERVEESMRRKPPATPGGISAEDHAYVPNGKNIVGGK